MKKSREIYKIHTNATNEHDMAGAELRNAIGKFKFLFSFRDTSELEVVNCSMLLLKLNHKLSVN